jgi:hypothetical protein
MKNGLIAIAALILLEPSILAEEQEKMPSSAKDALTKMDQEIERAKTIAVVTLKRTLVEETRKGNIKTAVLIQSKIDELSVPSYILGKWKESGTSHTYEITAGGDVISNHGNNGKWTINKSKLSCAFPNGTWTLDLPPKNGVVKGTFSTGLNGNWTKEP